MRRIAHMAQRIELLRRIGHRGKERTVHDRDGEPVKLRWRLDQAPPPPARASDASGASPLRRAKLLILAYVTLNRELVVSSCPRQGARRHDAARKAFPQRFRPCAPRHHWPSSRACKSSRNAVQSKANSRQTKTSSMSSGSNKRRRCCGAREKGAPMASKHPCKA